MNVEHVKHAHLVLCLSHQLHVNVNHVQLVSLLHQQLQTLVSDANQELSL